jgi:hypothetical protein
MANAGNYPGGDFSAVIDRLILSGAGELPE